MKLYLDLDNFRRMNNEIDVTRYIVYEVEQITAVAGVRGVDSQDEALEHLYYRRSQ